MMWACGFKGIGAGGVAGNEIIGVGCEFEGILTRRWVLGGHFALWLGGCFARCFLRLLKCFEEVDIGLKLFWSVHGDVRALVAWMWL